MMTALLFLIVNIVIGCCVCKFIAHKHNTTQQPLFQPLTRLDGNGAPVGASEHGQLAAASPQGSAAAYMQAAGTRRIGGRSLRLLGAQRYCLLDNRHDAGQLHVPQLRDSKGMTMMVDKDFFSRERAAGYDARCLAAARGLMIGAAAIRQNIGLIWELLAVQPNLPHRDEHGRRLQFDIGFFCTS